MTILTPEARALLDSDALVHLATIDPDGAPQVSCVWAGLDGEEILTAHMMRRRKVKNVERDPRVTVGRDSSRRTVR